MAKKKGLDPTFIKYGISQSDLSIIEDVCQVDDVDRDWLEQLILAPCQEYRNSGKNLNAEATCKIIKDALKQL